MSLNILFLTPQLPYPPRTGAALRNFGLISGLAERHNVSLLSFADDDELQHKATGTNAPLAEMCQQLQTLPIPRRERLMRIRDLLSGQADMARRLWSEAYANSLGKMLAETRYDVVHIGGLEMALYLETLQRSNFAGMIVFDDYNAEAALQRRIFEIDLRNPRRWHVAAYSFAQWRRLIHFETSVCRRASQVFAVSGLDAALLQSLKHSTPVTVIPNAIHTATYEPESTPPDVFPHPALVFTGKMDYRPNVDAATWFATQVLPLVQREVPQTHFAIVGQKPHARLDTLRHNPAITITGAVEFIQPYIAAADIYVAPVRMGSGTRFKLLEAMAMKRPIVSTSRGAEGLDIRHGHELVLADSAEQFAAAIVQLLHDDARRQRLGEQAYTFVRKHYDWQNIIPRVEAVYESV